MEQASRPPHAEIDTHAYVHKRTCTPATVSMFCATTSPWCLPVYPHYYVGLNCWECHSLSASRSGSRGCSHTSLADHLAGAAAGDFKHLKKGRILPLCAQSHPLPSPPFPVPFPPIPPSPTCCCWFPTVLGVKGAPVPCPVRLCGGWAQPRTAATVILGGQVPPWLSPASPGAGTGRRGPLAH